MDRVLFSSQSVHWPTPQALYDVLHAEFIFDFDPCPLQGHHEADILVNWFGHRVYCNPPYGKDLGKWLMKGKEAELAVFLLPARTDTPWFHHYCLKASEIRFIKGRLRFGDAKWSAPFPSMLVIYRG